MEEIIIRKVESKDAVGLVTLNNLVWRIAYKDIFPEEVFAERDEYAAKKIQNFDQIYYNGDDEICYVAETDGKIVGFVLGRIISDYDYFKNLGYADLQAVYILPEYQGRGVSSKFKNLFVNWAREHGATKFVIGVLKDNNKARKVYEKWGGKLDPHTEPFVKLGVGYEEVFYTYKLD